MPGAKGRRAPSSWITSRGGASGGRKRRTALAGSVPSTASTTQRSSPAGVQVTLSRPPKAGSIDRGVVDQRPVQDGGVGERSLVPDGGGKLVRVLVVEPPPLPLAGEGGELLLHGGDALGEEDLGEPHDRLTAVLVELEVTDGEAR